MKAAHFKFAREKKGSTGSRADGVWDRRIAICFHLAVYPQRRDQPTLQVAEMLLSDKEDLIHKAVGWMLGENSSRFLKNVI